MTSHKFENLLKFENHTFESEIDRYILKMYIFSVFLAFLDFYKSRRCFVRSQKNCLDKQSETCQNIYSLNDFPQI